MQILAEHIITATKVQYSYVEVCVWLKTAPPPVGANLAAGLDGICSLLSEGAVIHTAPSLIILSAPGVAAVLH